MECGGSTPLFHCLGDSSSPHSLGELVLLIPCVFCRDERFLTERWSRISGRQKEEAAGGGTGRLGGMGVGADSILSGAHRDAFCRPSKLTTRTATQRNMQIATIIAISCVALCSINASIFACAAAPGNEQPVPTCLVPTYPALRFRRVLALALWFSAPLQYSFSSGFSTP